MGYLLTTTKLLASNIKIVTLLLMLVVSPSTSFAIEVQGLYRVQTEVDDHSDRNLWKAVLSSFKEVLVRKSGSRKVLEAHEVQQAYKKVKVYLQRYEYTNHAEPGEEQGFQLILDFEPRLIDDLIQQAGMPIWGSDRPVTMLWLAVEGQTTAPQLEPADVAATTLERRIIKDDPAELMSEVVKQNAVRLGLPVILPLMDLEDELNVELSDVWGRFSEPVRAASQRYGAGTILLGRVSQQQDIWQAKFSYLNDSSEQTFELVGQDAESLLSAITESLAEQLCATHCVVEAAESNQIFIQVSNIGNFARFKQLQSFLQKLPSIRKLEVIGVAGVNVRFAVDLLGDIQAVREGVSLNGLLIEDLQPDSKLFGLVKPDQSVNTVDAILQQATVEQPKNPVGESVEQTLSIPEPQLEETVTLYYRWTE